jgi:hypothetical protein
VGLNFFQRRKILKGSNVLEMTPVRLHEHILNDNGQLTLIVPKFKNEALANFCIPKRKSKNFKINLDELGSATWLEIDGRQTVAGICEQMVIQFGDKIQPAEDRIPKFLSLLYEQRYITFKELIEFEKEKKKNKLTKLKED